MRTLARGEPFCKLWLDAGHSKAVDTFKVLLRNYDAGLPRSSRASNSLLNFDSSLVVILSTDSNSFCWSFGAHSMSISDDCR